MRNESGTAVNPGRHSKTKNSPSGWAMRWKPPGVPRFFATAGLIFLPMNTPTKDYLDNAICFIALTVAVLAGICHIYPKIRHKFSKLRGKGYSWKIASLVILAGCLFSIGVGTLVLYLFDYFFAEKPTWLSFAMFAMFPVLVYAVVPLVAAAATLLPDRRASIAGRERDEWKLDLRVAYGLAGLFWVPIPVLLLWHPAGAGAAGLFAVSLILALSGWFFFALAHNLKRRVAAAKYLKSSKTIGAHVLYLREFEHEREPFIYGSPLLALWPRGQNALLPAVPREPVKPRNLLLDMVMLRGSSTTITFEQYLSPAIESGLAPLVALGRPDDYLPPSGALREYATDHIWQERFKELAFRSKAILLQAGSSQSLNWELSLLLSKGLASKLFVVLGPLAFGPTGPHGQWLQKLNNWVAFGLEPLDWSRFIAAMRMAGYNIAPHRPTLPALLAFDRDGNSHELAGGFKTPEEYVRAIKRWLS